MKLNWIHFRDNETNIDVEGRWAKVSDHEAIFYITEAKLERNWLCHQTVKLDNNIKIYKQEYMESQWISEYIASQVNIREMKKITVVGHSYGGAVAQATVWRIQKKYPNLTIKCVLFGSTKAGNKNFVESIRYITESYRHKSDIFPFFPLIGSHHKHLVFGVFTPNIVESHLKPSYNFLYDKYNLR